MIVNCFLESNDILNESQHGFRKGISITPAVVEFIHEIIGNLELNRKTAGILIDLSEAFDSVSHETLLTKLDYYGIRGGINDHIRSYLTGHKQYKEIFWQSENFLTKVESNFDTITIGVLQGSVLGPLLFLMYVNDIPSSSDFSVISYPTLISSGQNLCHLETNLIESLKSIKSYLSINELKLNVDKTLLINFKFHHDYQQQNLNVEVDNESVNQTDCHKFLGIFIDQNLTYNKHVDTLCNKINSNIFLLRYFSRYLETDALLSVYYGIIFSQLQYSIEI